MKRVVICQRFLPHYRISFFQHLGQKLSESGYELRVFYSLTIGEFPPPPWATKLCAVKKRLNLGELTETAVFAPTLFLHLLSARPSIVVVEDLAGLPSSLVAALYCRLFKKPYLVWGLGRVPSKTPSRLRRIFSCFIQFLYSGTAGFICYSKHAESVYQEYGKPTFIAQNSCLPRPSELEIEWVKQTIKQKRYAVLLNALAKLPGKNIELHLIGMGPERERLVQLTHHLGISKRVVFHGSLYLSEEKRSIFSKSHIGILPGRGGLAIQEMMASGLPVISGVADGTEEDLLQNGHNGYIIKGFPDVQDLVDSLLEFFKLSLKQRQKMANNGLETVVDHFNIENMAEGFLNAIYSIEKKVLS